MDVKWLIEATVGATELAKATRIEVQDRQDKRRVERVRSIIEALRQIYFMPRGVVSLLADLAEGIQPSEAQVVAILPVFNDFRFHMHRYMDRLDPQDGQPDKTLSLKAERVLREISYGKAGVRERIQDLLNGALTHGSPVPPEKATEVLSLVEGLNAAIEEAEEELMKALKAG